MCKYRWQVMFDILSRSEKRSKMKKEQEATERFAFHFILNRDIALKLATDGLQCEQLTFSIDKYLGLFFL